jgi:glycosyltransferase involved in cell wall biosynthesis
MISILCGLKNRSNHLLQTYKSWLACKCVDEIVIVDWGSDVPIAEELEEHEKLKIVQVNRDHAKYWAFSQAYNTAARFAVGDSYVIMNADEILVSPNSLCILERPPADFCYEGTSWESSKAHGVYFLYIRAATFWRVNGYHEKILGYGYDDVDLRRRLINEGVEIKEANVEIEHIKHEATHKSRENMLNYGISWVFPWGIEKNPIELEWTKKDGIIYCDIDIDSRITEEEMQCRNGMAKALSQQQKSLRGMAHIELPEGGVLEI